MAALDRPRVTDETPKYAEHHQDAQDWLTGRSKLIALADALDALNWDRLELYCSAQRIARTLNRAVVELTSWGRWADV